MQNVQILSHSTKIVPITDSSSRDKTMDILKGFGIIFVILGHICPYKNINTYIYSFHMALFFFISGYLLYNKKRKNIVEILKKSFFNIMVPYYIFLIISIFFTETFISFMRTGSFFSYFLNIKEIGLAFLLGGGYLDIIPCSNFPLWYLPLYFVAKICFELIIYNEKVRKLLPIFIIVFIILTIPIQNLLPGRPFLHINILAPALVFMGIGYLFRKYQEKDKQNIIVIGIALIIGIIVSYINGGNISEINHLIYFVGAICSIYFWYSMAKQSNNKILEYIGKGSIIIYPLHCHIIDIYIYSGIEDVLSMNWKYDAMFVIIKLIFVLIIGLLISKGFNKFKSTNIQIENKRRKVNA